MDYSVFHFFSHLVRSKDSFESAKKLDDFPFDMEMLSYKGTGRFPDMAIKLNNNRPEFRGGELIELKDSDGLTIASFNSTIPSGKKDIRLLTRGRRSMLRSQMEDAGDDIESLQTRDVYYLVRSRGHNKVCLIHGNFFETIGHIELIKAAFKQILEERETAKGNYLEEDIKKRVVELFDERDSIAKVRHIDDASVNLRFRIMAEVNEFGNIFKYEEIEDNTLTFVAP